MQIPSSYNSAKEIKSLSDHPSLKKAPLSAAKKRIASEGPADLGAEAVLASSEIMELSIFFIEEFWRDVEQAIEQGSWAPRPVSAGTDLGIGMSQVLVQVQDFLFPIAQKTQLRLTKSFRSGDRGLASMVFARYNNVLLSTPTHGGKPAEHIKTNATMGLDKVVGFAEVVAPAFSSQFAGKEIWCEEYRRIINSQQFTELCEAVGFSARIALLSGFLSSITKGTANIGGVQRAILDPELFVFVQRDGVRTLQICPDKMEAIKIQVREGIDTLSTALEAGGADKIAGCPALYAILAEDDKKTTVYRKFLKFVLSAVDEIYISSLTKREEI